MADVAPTVTGRGDPAAPDKEQSAGWSLQRLPSPGSSSR